MKLSVSELSYLRESLANEDGPLRPDSRLPTQHRPFKVKRGIISSAFGSASVTNFSGAECIAGVKLRVERILDSEVSSSYPIEISLDVAGLKDNDNMIVQLAGVLEQALLSCPKLVSRLKINSNWQFRLFIDVVVLAHTANPLTLVSMAIAAALADARLPRELNFDDRLDATKLETSYSDVIEVPQFEDDWALSYPILPNKSLNGDWSPPIHLVVALVGKNMLFDPSESEQAVADAVIALTYKDGSVAAPIEFLDVADHGYESGINPQILLDVYDMVNSAAPPIIRALDTAGLD